jgi:hypothetical protein
VFFPNPTPLIGLIVSRAMKSSYSPFLIAAEIQAEKGKS